MTSNERTVHADKYLKGIEFLSTGACKGCNECHLPNDATDEEIDVVSEPHFSWRQCEVCGSTLGGDRHPSHGVATLAGVKQILHFSVCVDCVMSIANGEPYPDEHVKAE